MSTVTDMPETLNFLGISQEAQVIHDDKPKWLLDALNDAVGRMVKKSERYQKKSSIKLEIKFVPDQMNQIQIETLLKEVEPDPSPLPMFGYVDSKGRLYGEDPNQMRLPVNEPASLDRSTK